MGRGPMRYVALPPRIYEGSKASIHPRTIEFPVIANQRAGFSGNPHLEKYMVSMTREIPTPVTSVTGSE